ncbi:WS/DGAT/MGAT family O-acyltransferase [Mycobacterium sp.]|uniref:WS/DGAT/MGAT family O-acyltransferase n=1 Tax=Mycobacterium sp. TaxID=1785 RepID=UPI003D1037C0
MKRIGGIDALLLYSETPNVHAHTLKVSVFDIGSVAGDFGYDSVRRALRRRLHLLEPLRYRLIDIPLNMHHAMWLEDCEVELDYHVRRAAIASPGGRRELDDLIGEIASTPLDRSRPLWEFHVVEGMADHRVAVVCKVHHALADGVAAGNMMAVAIDWDTSLADEQDGYAPSAPLSKPILVQKALADHLRQVRQLPRLLKHTADGVSQVKRRSRERDVHPHLARSFRLPATFLNHRLSPARTFASATLALADVKETSKQLGVTINDLILAMSSGALRELLLHYDGHADDPLIAMVPASLDTSPHRVAGNELGGMLVSLPVQLGDALERVRLTHLSTAIAKENFHLLGPALFSRWAAYFPPVVSPIAFRWLSRRDAHNKLLNVTISNVPGPRTRGHVGGVSMSEIYSVGPLQAGSGLNITVWSYVDQLNISVISDDRTFEDTHEVTDAMLRAFVDIRDAAGLPTGLTHVETAMAPTGRVV